MSTPAKMKAAVTGSRTRTKSRESTADATRHIPMSETSGDRPPPLASSGTKGSSIARMIHKPEAGMSAVYLGASEA